MDNKPLTVLVTGSSGFIGTHVVRHLTAAGHRVIGYDLIPPEDRFPDGSIYLCGDIRTDRLPHQGIDAVVHLAALADVRASMDRPFDYDSINVTGTLRLLEHCRIHGIRHFIFASLSGVHDPSSPYALTKLHGEQWGRLYSRLHGLRFLALRIDACPATDLHPDHASRVCRGIEQALSWSGPESGILDVGNGKIHSVMNTPEFAQKSTGLCVSNASESIPIRIFCYFSSEYTNLKSYVAVSKNCDFLQINCIKFGKTVVARTGKLGQMSNEFKKWTKNTCFSPQKRPLFYTFRGLLYTTLHMNLSGINRIANGIKILIRLIFNALRILSDLFSTKSHLTFHAKKV